MEDCKVVKEKIDLLICLNQSLVPLQPNEREFCTYCIRSITWTHPHISYGPTYLVWDGLFITGKWDCKTPNVCSSVYESNEYEWHIQRLFQHPFLMMNRFLSEAAEKVKTHSSLLKEEWGQDQYEAIVASFEDIFDSLTKLKEYAWYQVCYQRPPLNAIYRRGNSIKRRLFLKLRKLIKLVQCAIDKETHGQWKIMAPHLFDNPETCLLRFEAQPQPESSESCSSDDKEY